MRKLLVAVTVLVCALVLSSCSLLPFGPDGQVLGSDHDRADAQMEKLAAALNSQDAGAVTDLLSERAQAQASGLDDGIQYLFSMFPDRGVTWELNSVNSESRSRSGKFTEVLWSYYKLTAGGKDYWLFFADFSINTIDPDNVGPFAVGATAWKDNWDSDEARAFVEWEASFDIDGSGEPGVYVPSE